MAVTDVGRRAWADLGGDPQALGLIDDPSPGLVLPARLDVNGLLADSVGLATLAIQEVQHLRGQSRGRQRVRIAGDRVTTSAQSERHLRVDGAAPTFWGSLSGFWRTSDGWVRTHGNYPHHAHRLASLLGISADSPGPVVAEAIAAWPAVSLESAAAEVGAIVGAVRGPEEWAAHPQAVALASAPLLDVRHEETARTRPWSGGSSTPLDGVRVLDLTRVIAGPIGTRNLAFAGADVLRVDSPQLPELEIQHLDTGAGKRSTTLDLDSAADRRTFDELAASADIVVTGYRPGALDRHGLSAEALWERCPGVVVGTVSAWSDRGPWAHKRGFDSIVQAVSGIAVIESTDGSTPGTLPAQALDHSAGHLLAAGLTYCLGRQRQVGGSWSTAVALARIAHELIGLPRAEPTSTQPPAPTVQEGTTAAGELVCPVPPLTYPGAPSEYPELAGPWGVDAPRW
jgi:crotonobetainyl-CoA:carnitine CoA-transferase CaiB-like acyl-CoA transferase